MKKLYVIGLLIQFATVAAMVRAGVDVGPGPVYYENGYYDNDYYDDWYGPGVYYGVYFSDYPTYYTWRRNYRYYGGPYYWRGNYHHGYSHGHWHGDGHHHGHHGHGGRH